jgi:(4S)-4-hydroxy-5-phosphonooxypentane-2,3-dione isomerase
MSKVYLFVDVTIKPGKRDEFLPLLQDHAAHIRKEEGCEALEVFVDTQSENICVWEVWTNRPLWDAHMVNDRSKAWQKVAPAYVQGETIKVMDSI